MTEPGWYTDDEDPSLARWHDGTGWTHHTMPKPDPTRTAVPVEPTPVAAEPAPPVAPVAPEPRVPWGSPEPVAPPPVVPSPSAPTPSPPVASPRPEPRPDPRPDPRPSPRPAPRPTPPAAKAPTAPRAAKAPKPQKTSKTAGSRPSWLRWQLAVPVVAVLVVAFLLVRLLGGDGSTDLLKSDLQSYGADFRTIDGSSYRITVVPSSEELDKASPGGCFKAPAADRANFGFAVRIENRSDKAVPYPDVTFAVNATPDGQLDLSPESLSGTNRQIELTPAAKGASCSDASAIRPAGRGKLGKGEAVTFRGVVGGIVTPASGLALIIRYVQGDPTTPSVASTADILATFPPAPKKK